MRSYVVFTQDGPILALTSRPGITDRRLLTVFERRGIDKFIACEVPLERVRSLYGRPFDLVADEVKTGAELRVLDFNGPHIVSRLSLSDLGRPILHEH